MPDASSALVLLMFIMPYHFFNPFPFFALFVEAPANQGFLSHAPSTHGKIFGAINAIVLTPPTDGIAFANALGIFAIFITGGANISTF